MEAAKVDTPSSNFQTRPLTHRPLLLRTYTLSVHIVLSLVWITVLVLSWRIKSPLNGSAFLLDGFVSGYISSALKFFAELQVTALDELMPYISMASQSPKDTKASRTVMVDYFPYNYLYPRLRILLNGHRRLFFVEWATFLGTLVLVQFSANILHPVYDNNSGAFLGWLPNRTIISIVIACHILLLLVTLFLILWLNNTTTGLLPMTQPGSLTTTIGMLHGGMMSGNGEQDDFLGLDGEYHRWSIRKQLAGNEYRLGYWESGDKLYYGIGRRNTGKEKQGRDLEGSPYSPRPRFIYIPWFLRPLALSIAVSILTTFLAIAATLIRGTDALENGFSPHGSMFVSPTLLLSPAGFLWSFIPSMVADFYGLFFKSIDTFYRVTQPTVTETDGPRSGTKLPLGIAYHNPYTALRHHHWKVAFSSLISLVASFIPPLAANMFYPDFNESGEPRIFIYQQSFLLVIGLVVVVLLSLLGLIPDVTRNLPHDLETLADRFSFLCGSSLLSDGRFAFKEEELLKPPPRSMSSVSVSEAGVGWSLKAMVDWVGRLVVDVKKMLWDDERRSHEECVQRRLDDGFQVGFGEGRNIKMAVIDRREKVILPYAGGSRHFWRTLRENVI